MANSSDLRVRRDPHDTFMAPDARRRSRVDEHSIEVSPRTDLDQSEIGINLGVAQREPILHGRKVTLVRIESKRDHHGVHARNLALMFLCPKDATVRRTVVLRGK